MARLTVVLFALAALVGCGPKVQEVQVNTTVTHYATMDDTWLANCPILPPPSSKPAYQKASLQERIDLWSAFYVQYARVAGGCNITLTNARKYNAAKRNETQTLVCKAGVCK